MGTVKRLFVALPLPSAAVKALGKYRDKMGRETPYLRWTSIANLHITALFVGEVAEEDVLLVEKAVAGVASSARTFTVIGRGAFYAPPRCPLNMVWFVCEESRPFFNFAKELAESLSVLRRDGEKVTPVMDWQPHKTKTPHATLARFNKSVLPQKLRRLRRTSLEAVPFSMRSCLLMESVLTPAGPVYRLIREYPLTS